MNTMEKHMTILKKTDLVFSKIFLPEHIPKEFLNREYLWNEVEKIEKSKNSQLARNLLFTLPRELSEEDRIKLISEFIEENFTSRRTTTRPYLTYPKRDG